MNISAFALKVSVGMLDWTGLETLQYPSPTIHTNIIGTCKMYNIIVHVSHMYTMHVVKVNRA